MEDKLRFERDRLFRSEKPGDFDLNKLEDRVDLRRRRILDSSTLDFYINENSLIEGKESEDCYKKDSNGDIYYEIILGILRMSPRTKVVDYLVNNSPQKIFKESEEKVVINFGKNIF